MKIEDLITGFQKWAKDTIVAARVKNNELGYKFVSGILNFTESINTKTCQTFFDRKDQNDKYETNYNGVMGGAVNPQDRQSYAWYQNEINMIYSFHKCFAMRHHSRLEYYRKDLSQKGARTLSAINNAVGTFSYKRDIADKKTSS